MAITEAQVLDAIRESVGDVDAATGDPPDPVTDGVIYQNIDTWWAMHEAKDLVASGLRAAYTRRDAIRRVMAVLVQKRFDTADNLSGLSIRGNQVYLHYQDMLLGANADVVFLEKKSSVGGTPAVGRNETTLTPAPASYTDDWMQLYRDWYAASQED